MECLKAFKIMILLSHAVIILCKEHYVIVTRTVDYRSLSNWFNFSSVEVGQQQAAMFFRSEPNWELAEPLHDLGMGNCSKISIC